MVAALVLVAAASDGEPKQRKERRMSVEERAAVLERLQKNNRAEPPCVPFEDPPVNTSKCAVRERVRC